MAITARGTNSANTSGSFSIVCNMPASLANNDVTNAIGAAGQNSTDFDVTESTGTWTELTDQWSDGSAADVSGAVYYKKQGSTPDTSVTIKNNAGGSYGWGAAVIGLIGVDTTTPIDATTTTATGTGDGIPNPPSITTATNGAWVIAHGASSEGATAVTNAPSGYSNLASNGGGFGVAVRAMLSSKEVASAGAEDPGSYTDPDATDSTGDSWFSASVAFKPAGGGGATVYPLLIDGGILNAPLVGRRLAA